MSLVHPIGWFTSTWASLLSDVIRCTWLPDHRHISIPTGGFVGTVVLGGQDGKDEQFIKLSVSAVVLISVDFREASFLYAFFKGNKCGDWGNKK